mmetsp:Transcript_12639/g.37139  ORF Transcript_12639/g.37139 Transcript_12639/m.37139 type:complete len:202 (-) Transcript_12639:276-881(-)
MDEDPPRPPGWNRRHGLRRAGATPAGGRQAGRAQEARRRRETAVRDCRRRKEGECAALPRRSLLQGGLLQGEGAAARGDRPQAHCGRAREGARLLLWQAPGHRDSLPDPRGSEPALPPAGPRNPLPDRGRFCCAKRGRGGRGSIAWAQVHGMRAARPRLPAAREMKLAGRWRDGLATPPPPSNDMLSLRRTSVPEPGRCAR